MIKKKITSLIAIAFITMSSSLKTETSYALPPSTVKAGLPITIATTNYDAYASIVDPTAMFGVGLAYNLFFGPNLALGLTGGMAFSFSAPNPSYIGGGASINYVFIGGAATTLEGDFLSMKSYPELTAYAGAGFAAKQFDFTAQVTAAQSGGQAITAGPTDQPSGTFYGLMIVGGVDYAIYNDIILGGEFHFITSLAGNPEIDPIANIIEIIVGAGYML